MMIKSIRLATNCPIETDSLFEINNHLQMLYQSSIHEIPFECSYRSDILNFFKSIGNGKNGNIYFSKKRYDDAI